MDPKELKEQQKKEIYQAIQYHAAQIYELIEPGLMVTVNLKSSSVVVPGQPQLAERLIIMRPSMSFSIAST